MPPWTGRQPAREEVFAERENGGGDDDDGDDDDDIMVCRWNGEIEIICLSKYYYDRGGRSGHLSSRADGSITKGCLYVVLYGFLRRRSTLHFEMM